MFEVVDPEHRLRPQVEATIRAAFRRGHGAHLATLPHWLVANCDADGISCAASLRFSTDGFFSEHYLDRPIEAVIADRTGALPDRGRVAEVGSLAAGRPGEVRDMVCGIVRMLQDRGMGWAFFTATARLRTYLRRAGIPLIDLAAADPARIEAAETWGTYYRQDPHVMLVGDAMLAAALHRAPAGGGHA